MAFTDLPLSDEVLLAVEMAGYDIPTPVQSEIVPLIQEGRDVLAQSQTGTGKTAAFALPILSRIDLDRREPQVLVLTPTRELAIQVAKSFSTYAKTQPAFAVAAIYGGQDYNIQFRQLARGVHVVVGTPGRVIDHLRRGTLQMDQIDCLVLDEADEMLNMGFLEDVEFVLDQTPDHRQVALFSATLPLPIRKIAKRYLNDPAKVTIKNKTMTADLIRQRALFVAPYQKLDALTRLLEAEETDGVIVFTRTREATVQVADELGKRGLNAVALNGDMPQKARERTIERLRAGSLDILVATDVAARGLDVARISHVFNYDAPYDSQSYIHRVGRTGRAGRTGEAIIFLTHQQRTKLPVIERATRQPIEVVEPPSAAEINALRVQRFKDQIRALVEAEDLAFFEGLVAELAEESEIPRTTIAAALARLGHGERPFLMTEEPRRKPRRPDAPRQKRGAPRSGRTIRPGLARYRIEVGQKDGAKPGHIVGAVANEGGIDGRDIGAIEIHDTHSTIDLPKKLPRPVLALLGKARVSGKQIRLTRVGSEASETDERRAKFSKKPHFKKQKRDKKKKKPKKRKK